MAIANHWSAAILASCLALCPAAAEELSAEERAWLEGDSDTTGVNDGELTFLTGPRGGRLHYHYNHITLTLESLDSGWIRLQQCHEGLDAVPRAEVLFRAGRVRDLAVLSSANIERAWVEGATVQLAGVERGARLCLSAESRALHHEGEGLYVLRNGPYMRRFLDGYYPLRVSMRIEYPSDRLEWVGIEPEPQPGFRVEREGAALEVDAWFEGRLRTAIYFLGRTPESIAGYRH